MERQRGLVEEVPRGSPAGRVRAAGWGAGWETARERVVQGLAPCPLERWKQGQGRVCRPAGLALDWLGWLMLQVLRCWALQVPAVAVVRWQQWWVAVGWLLQAAQRLHQQQQRVPGLPQARFQPPAAAMKSAAVAPEAGEPLAAGTVAGCRGGWGGCRHLVPSRRPPPNYAPAKDPGSENEVQPAPPLYARGHPETHIWLCRQFRGLTKALPGAGFGGCAGSCA